MGLRTMGSLRTAGALLLCSTVKDSLDAQRASTGSRRASTNALLASQLVFRKRYAVSLNAPHTPKRRIEAAAPDEMKLRTGSSRFHGRCSPRVHIQTSRAPELPH